MLQQPRRNGKGAAVPRDESAFFSAAPQALPRPQPEAPAPAQAARQAEARSFLSAAWRGGDSNGHQSSRELSRPAARSPIFFEGGLPRRRETSEGIS